MKVLRAEQPAVRPANSLSVVIPAYNEEEILDSTVRTIVEALRGWDLTDFEVIVCENGSSDGTLPLAKSLADEMPEVHVVSLPGADYGAAMRAGFVLASCDVIVNFDADYYDLTFLERAMTIDADIVVAAKGILGSNDARVLTRRIVSRAFARLVRGLLQVQVTETHGMKLFRRDAIQDILVQVRSTKDLFDTELLARAEWLGRKIEEEPIETIELRHSRSGILRRIPRTMWGLITLRFKLRRQRSQRVRPLPQAQPSYDIAV